MLKPGLHTAVMGSLAYNEQEDRINAMFAVGKSQIAVSNYLNMSFSGLYDFIDITKHSPPRYALNRHYKAKPQPNCGPRGNNPW